MWLWMLSEKFLINKEIYIEIIKQPNEYVFILTNTDEHVKSQMCCAGHKKYFKTQNVNCAIFQENAI